MLNLHFMTSSSILYEAFERDALHGDACLPTHTRLFVAYRDPQE